MRRCSRSVKTRRSWAYVAVALVASVAACAPSASLVGSTDASHFATKPVIVRRGRELTLSFRQGTYPFFFLVECVPASGRLVCAVRGSSSSGSLAGRSMEQPLDSPGALEALEAGGAFFREPDGHLTPLRAVVLGPPPG